MKRISIIFFGFFFAILAQFAMVQAADYPNRPVRMVVPGAPGVSGDITARLVSEKLSALWKYQVVVDNRPGAGGIVGAKQVVTATPDGYTLLATNPGPGLQNAILRKKPAYSLSDFEPVVYIGYTPLILAANPKLPAKNITEFIAYAKSNPGKVKWASPGSGSNPHTALEVFKHLAGIKVLHVPYKGGALVLTGLMSGEVDVYYTTVASAEAYVSDGKLKILGVGGPKRLPGHPAVATLSEQGIDNAGANYWYGISAPAGTPRPIIEKINHDVNKVLQMPDVRKGFSRLGIELKGGTPEDFSAFIKSGADRLSSLVKAGALPLID